MPGGRRGLVAPQNTFLENIIRRSNQQRKYKSITVHKTNLQHFEIKKKPYLAAISI